MARKATGDSDGNGSGNGKRKEAFTLFAPSAGDVQLVGDFTSWQEKPIRLKKARDGTWKATVTLEPGVHEYRFLVDGEWKSDPECTESRPNPFGAENSVREVR
jgi:1,4-alpha-glucan branching enzyme